MEKEIFYQLKQDALTLKKQEEILNFEEEKEQRLYNELAYLNQYIHTKKINLFWKVIENFCLLTMLSFGFLIYQSLLFSPILIIPCGFEILLLGLSVVVSNKFAKDAKKELDKNQNLKKLTNKELKEKEETLSNKYKSVKGTNESLKYVVKLQLQDLKEEIIKLPIQPSNNDDNKNQTNILSEFLNEPVNYKNIHLDELGEIECDKKKTKMYNKE